MLRYVWAMLISTTSLFGCVEGKTQQGSDQSTLPVASLVGFTAKPGRVTYDVRIENPTKEVLCFSSYSADKAGAQVGIGTIFRLSRNDRHLRLDQRLSIPEDIVDGIRYGWSGQDLTLLPGGFLIARDGLEWFEDQAIPIKRRMETGQDPVPFTNEPFDPSEPVYLELDITSYHFDPGVLPRSNIEFLLRTPDFVLKLQ